MKPTWILIANASKARLYERSTAHAPLILSAQFEHQESRARDADLTNAGLGHGLGAATYEPRLDPKDKEHALFAAQLANHLNAGLSAQQTEQVVVIASNPFLGKIKQHLNALTAKAVKATIASDLTAYDGDELTQRIDSALNTRPH